MISLLNRSKSTFFPQAEDDSPAAIHPTTPNPFSLPNIPPRVQQEDAPPWKIPQYPKLYDRNFDSRRENSNRETFSFAQLETPGSQLSNPNYTAIHDAPNGFFILKREKKSVQTKGRGWKIHIDLALDRNNFANAWDCVVPVLRRYRINIFKMMTLDAASKPVYHVTQGRQMTLYVQREALSRSQWIALLGELGYELRRHGIRRGGRSSICRTFFGSDYFSYRNDSDPRGNYVSVEAAAAFKTPEERFNPSGATNPFAGIILDERVACSTCLPAVKVTTCMKR